MKKKQKFKFPNQVKGWLSYQEGKLLYQLAQVNPHLGAVVELGCFHGRSTICLIQGSQKVKGGKVYSIDNFSWDKKVDRLPNFYPHFNKNLKKWHLRNKVVVFRGETNMIVKKWQQSIRLLFIDASHFYPNVLKDYLNWSKWVAQGGIIAFHDSEWPGVHRLIRELVLQGQLKNLKAIKGKNSTGLSYAFKPLRKERSSQWQRWRDWLKFNLFFLDSFWPRFKMDINQRSVYNPKDFYFRFFGHLNKYWQELKSLS